MIFLENVLAWSNHIQFFGRCPSSKLNSRSSGFVASWLLHGCQVFGYTTWPTTGQTCRINVYRWWDNTKKKTCQKNTEWVKRKKYSEINKSNLKSVWVPEPFKKNTLWYPNLIHPRKSGPGQVTCRFGSFWGAPTCMHDLSLPLGLQYLRSPRFPAWGCMISQPVAVAYFANAQN